LPGQTVPNQETKEKIQSGLARVPLNFDFLPLALPVCSRR